MKIVVSDKETLKEFLDAYCDGMKELSKMNKVPLGNERYSCLWDFIRQHGRTWNYKPLPKSIRWGIPKWCYRNAAHLAFRHKSLIYVEGLATHVIPLMHAWCVDKDGNVIDNTWRENKYPRDYFGIGFTTEYVRSVVQIGKRYGVIERWQEGYPLLSATTYEWKHPVHEQLKGSNETIIPATAQSNRAVNETVGTEVQLGDHQAAQAAAKMGACDQAASGPGSIGQGVSTRAEQ